MPAPRRLLRERLADQDVEPVTAEAVVLATGEAVTNAVEHAYLTGVPGTVRLGRHHGADVLVAPVPLT